MQGSDLSREARPATSAGRLPPWLDSSLRAIVGLVACYFVLHFSSETWSTDLAAMRVDVAQAGLALAVVALASAIMALRWKLVALVLHGETYPFAVAMRSFLLARFLGFFVSPVAMDLIGRRLGMRLQGNASSTTNVVVQIVVERWFDILLPAVLIAVFTSGLVSPDSPWLATAIGCVVGVLIGFFTLVPIVRVLTWLRLRLSRQPQAVVLPTLSTATIAAIALLGGLRWLVVIWHTQTIAAAFGLDLGGAALTLGTATSQLAAVIAITPGGLGIQEAGWLVGLQSAATSAQAGSVIAIAQRIGAASCFGILAGISWLYLPSRARKHELASSIANAGLEETAEVERGELMGYRN